jgi:hypothetical protein
MIFFVDNSRSVPLVVGYEFMRDAQPAPSRGARFKRTRDAGAIPVGPAHAVEPGERRSICGKIMESPPTGNPWPPVMGSQCHDCREALI